MAAFGMGRHPAPAAIGRQEGPAQPGRRADHRDDVTRQTLRTTDMALFVDAQDRNGQGLGDEIVDEIDTPHAQEGRDTMTIQRKSVMHQVYLAFNLPSGRRKGGADQGRIAMAGDVARHGIFEISRALARVKGDLLRPPARIGQAQFQEIAVAEIAQQNLVRHDRVPMPVAASVRPFG